MLKFSAKGVIYLYMSSRRSNKGTRTTFWLHLRGFKLPTPSLIISLSESVQKMTAEFRQYSLWSVFVNSWFLPKARQWRCPAVIGNPWLAARLRCFPLLQWLSQQVNFRYSLWFSQDHLSLHLASYVCKYSHVVLTHVLTMCSKRFHMFIMDITHSSIRTSIYLRYGFLSKVGSASANKFPMRSRRPCNQFNWSIIRSSYRRFVQSIVTTGNAKNVIWLHDRSYLHDEKATRCHISIFERLHVNEQIEDSCLKRELKFGLVSLRTRIWDNFFSGIMIIV